MIALRHRQRGNRGFSLVEMSVVLVIIGAIGMVLWKFMPAIKSLPAIARLSATTLESSEDAVNGFILAQGRLPCPDTSGNGNENCAAGASLGWLPVRTLGLNLPEPVRYGVYRAASASLPLDADLGTLKNRYNPLLPDVVWNTFLGGQVALGGVVYSDSQVYPPGTISPQSNGLDFCAALINIARSPGTPMTAGARRVPIAYGLAVAGAGDADGDGSPFDGLNRVAGQFELAGAARSASYDDASRAVGAGELLTRLGCATRFPAVNGAARATYAAYDIDRFADMYMRFRDFDLAVMEGNVEQANVGIVMASVGLAIAIVNEALGIQGIEQSKGLTIAAAAAATAALVIAGYGEAAAILAKLQADDALLLAQSKLQPAKDFKALTAADFQAAIQRVQALDSKGLLP